MGNWVLFLLMCTPLLAERPLSLEIIEKFWILQVPGIGQVAPLEAARLAIVPCEHGKCLSVGPWRAGNSRNGARYVYATRIEGTVGGSTIPLAAAPLGGPLRLLLASAAGCPTMASRQGGKQEIR